MRPTLLACLFVAFVAFGACAAAPPQAPALWIFGEQHDQPDQQRQVADEVQRLADAGRLAAVVLEMAERGRSTHGLPRDADAARVQQALAWTDWPWDTYAGVVMNAVRAGVPVIGGNQPRTELRAAMADAALDTLVPAAAREQLAAAVRSGHCGLLPAAQEPGMVRVQIARDRALAATALAALAESGGRTVLMLMGAQHASRDRGVPLHLAERHALRVVMFGADTLGLQADERRPAETTPRPDACEAFRQRLAR